MLNGIFGKWLREFATLVLTQTVQAFLLAVVMTIIISCLGNANDEDTGNQAAGLLAIIALASFSKIELLVKNIFGVTSQFGDPSLAAGARGLTAGGLLAMRGGKRLLNNGSDLIKSHRMIKEAKSGLATYGTGEAAKNATLANNGEEIDDGTGTGNNTNTDAIQKTLDAGADMAETSLKVEGMSDISQLKSAIDALTRATEKANGGSQKEKYEAMLKEGKDLRRSAIRENIGAAIGGTAGAIVGLAQGDDVIEKTLAGAGAGDAIGAATARGKAQRIDYNNRLEKIKKDFNSLNEADYRNNLKDLDAALERQGFGKVTNGESGSDLKVRSKSLAREFDNKHRMEGSNGRIESTGRISGGAAIAGSAIKNSTKHTINNAVAGNHKAFKNDENKK